jgi:fatty acid desaturase
MVTSHHFLRIVLTKGFFRVQLMRDPSLAKEELVLKEVLHRPAIAFPTLGLLIACVVTFTVACATHRWTLFAISVYGAFTVLHDAVHHAVSPQYPWLNELAGHVAMVFFLPSCVGYFGAFRFIHLLHHKHTNDESKDPDTWTHGGLFKWATLDLGYMVFILRDPKRVPWFVWVEFLCVVSSFTFLAVRVLPGSVLLAWMIGHRLVGL